MAKGRDDLAIAARAAGFAMACEDNSSRVTPVVNAVRPQPAKTPAAAKMLRRSKVRTMAQAKALWSTLSVSWSPRKATA